MKKIKDDKSYSQTKFLENFEKTLAISGKILKKIKPFSYLSCQPVLVIMLAKRCYDLANAVRVLFQSGFTNEVIPILRTIFELRVTLLNISKDEELALRYVEHSDIQRKKIFNKLTKDDPMFSVKDRDNIEEKINSDVASLSNEFNGKYHFWYPQVTLEKACEELELMSEYIYIYGDLSRYCHNASLSLLEYYKIGKDCSSALLFQEEIPAEVLDKNCILAAESTNCIFCAVADYFDFDDEKCELISLDTELKFLLEKEN
jgi:hypothetical protein